MQFFQHHSTPFSTIEHLQLDCWLPVVFDWSPLFNPSLLCIPPQDKQPTPAPDNNSREPVGPVRPAAARSHASARAAPVAGRLPSWTVLGGRLERETQLAWRAGAAVSQ